MRDGKYFIASMNRGNEENDHKEGYK